MRTQQKGAESFPAKATVARQQSIDNPPSGEPAPRGKLSRCERWGVPIVIASLFLGTLLIALDTTIIGTAIPAITSSFHTLEDLAWYGSGYLLTVTALQPSFGKLYRLLNIKGVYVTCIVIFEVGSILCAAAPSSAVFIAGRAIAGFGAAGLLQGALVIITHSVPLEKRPLYMGIVISVFGICAGIGPVLGGTFTGKTSWRWCFWINVPIGAVVLALILVFLRIKSDNARRSFQPRVNIRQRLMELDPIGATLVIAAICCLLLALQWGGQSLPWKSSKVIGLCVGSGLLFMAFFVVQWKLGDDATLPFFILKQRSICSGALFLFFMGMPMTAYTYYVPIYFQSIKGSSALASGVDFLAFALPQIGLTIITGGLATTFGYYVPYMIVGTAISIVGSGLIMTLQVDTTTAKWAGFLIVCGLGTGMGVNHPYTAVQAVILEYDTPIANAVLQFAFQLGAALSLSISQTLFINKLRSEVRIKTPGIPPEMVISAGASNLPLIAQSPDTLLSLREAYTNAVRHVFIYCLAAACVGFVITFGFEHRNVKKVAKDRKAAEASSDKEDDVNQRPPACNDKAAPNRVAEER